MRFNKLDLNQLVVLDTLLATRSVGRAAEQLFLSQPATSCALARLRDYFEDQLLVPVGKTQVLTPLALELTKPVRDVLMQIHTITQVRPSFDPATSERRFVIESSDYVMSVFLSEVARRAAQVAPLVQFDLRVKSAQSPERLESGEVELLITPEFSTVPGHPTETLFEDSFSCVVCADYKPAGGALNADRYFEASHVAVEWGGGRRVTIDAQLLSIGKRTRRQDIIAPSFTLVPEFVIGTSRIATLPTRLARQLAQRVSVRVLPCPVEIPPFAEKLQWHKYQERDPAIAWLRSLFREVADDMPPMEAPLKPAARTKPQLARRKRAVAA